jgi:DNA adenine methylase
VKHRLPEVFPFLRQLKKGKKRYLKMRDSDLTRLSPAARAARFIYLNRFCFNGIYRTNLEGKFNVPYGGTKSGKLPSDEVLADCSRLLKRAKLIAGDFEEVLRHVQPRDFVYLDPPFLVGSRRVFREYNGAVFSTNDLKRLRSWLLRLDRLSVAFLLSYAECREAHALAIGFYKRRVTVNRSIAGFADTRRTARELLISNISPCKWRMNNHGN